MPFPDAPLRSLFRLQGEPAEYTPAAGGASANVRVLYGQPVRAGVFGGVSIAASGNILHVLAEDVAEPREGDRFVLTRLGLTLVVQGAPQRGLRGQVWELDTWRE